MTAPDRGRKTLRARSHAARWIFASGTGNSIEWNARSPKASGRDHGFSLPRNVQPAILIDHIGQGLQPGRRLRVLFGQPVQMVQVQGALLQHTLAEGQAQQRCRVLASRREQCQVDIKEGATQLMAHASARSRFPMPRAPCNPTMSRSHSDASPRKVARDDRPDLSLDRRLDQDLVERPGGVKQVGETVEPCVEIAIAQQEAEVRARST